MAENKQVHRSREWIYEALILLMKKSKFQNITISDIATKLNNYSINTLKKDIQYLLSEKQIEKIGKGRGTIYIINDEST